MVISMIIYVIVTGDFSVPCFCQAERKYHHLTDCTVSLFPVFSIADHSQSIIQIPDFVAFFFMSLSLLSVEILQHFILRSLKC